MVSQVRVRVSSSPSMPGFFRSSFWCLVMSSSSLYIMCPIHLHRLLMMVVLMLSWLFQTSSCSLEMVLGQKTHRNFRRLLLWNVDSLERLLCHSPALWTVQGVEKETLLWYDFSLVLAVQLFNENTSTRQDLEIFEAMCSTDQLEILQRGTVHAETVTVSCLMKSCRQQALSATHLQQIALITYFIWFIINVLFILAWHNKML